MSRLLAATVSIAPPRNRMPIAPGATGGAGCGTKVLRCHLSKIMRPAYPEGGARRELPPRCHHDRIF
jgi:hypothetical protein